MHITEQSRLILIYPFRCNETYDVRVATLRQARWRNVAMWEPLSIAAGAILPHIAAFWNAEDAKESTAQCWRLAHNALQGTDGWSANAHTRWEMLLPDETTELVHLREIRLYLFRAGIGFVTLHCELETTDADRWLDLQFYARFIGGQREAQPWRFRKQDAHGNWQPYLPAQIATDGTRATGFSTLGKIIVSLLSYNTDDRWWEEVYTPGVLIPFTMLFAHADTMTRVPEYLYRIRNCFPSASRRHTIPADDELLLDQHPAVLPYLHNQWFQFTLEGGSFFALNAPDIQYFRTDLPSNLSHEYLLIYLIVLQQRFSLMHLSHRVAQHWPLSAANAIYDRRLMLFNEIRDALMLFMARGYFSQVMQHTFHHRVYEHVQRLNLVEKLYAEVNAEVNEMYEYLLLKQNHDLQRIGEETQRGTRWLSEYVAAFSFIFGMTGLFAAYLGINLVGITTGPGMNPKAALMFLAKGFGLGVLCYLVTSVLWHGWQKRRQRQ